VAYLDTLFFSFFLDRRKKPRVISAGTACY